MKVSTLLLSGRNALVTGGSKGVGFGIATAYAQAGANVVLVARDAKAVESAAKRLRDDGYHAIGIAADVTNAEDFRKALYKGANQLGIIDILCNNAGITKVEDFFDIKEETWDSLFAVNAKAILFCSKIFAEYLKEKRQGGNIVIVSSNAAKLTFNGEISYCASKAAAANLAQSLAKELYPLGINVNAVCPGSTQSDMLNYCMECEMQRDETSEKTMEEIRGEWGNSYIGRIAEPIEVGKIVAFLSSEAATLIRGQAITIDAGITPY